MRCLQSLKNILSYLVDKSLIPSKDGDEILLQFKEFLDKVVKCSFSDFKTLDHKEQRLDTFLYQYFSVDKEKYRKLWDIVKMILILSHGQATVERGFSLNKALKVNWFTSYSRNIVNYMSAIGGSGLDLFTNMQPPKSLFIQVRCLCDYGDFETSDGNTVVLTKNSTHFLQRTDCEKLIHQGVLEHITV
ncbi:DNA replication complex GINS protein PSF1 [Araneus ventricosus]|uniref:DNA replication complex GINS protein PSF1 n=1 Tax=Araneus ventricosus TaxID=182803 RepID=A0A4Y2PHE9_ARAVE|nr:DNA replication complex GINS protein PSF1 [Araneus ventricosus]